ncbi:MAG TPA: ATP synthase F0 subunit C, partial [Nitrospiraceae bacterium]|nr:ATP synthase F0 subunit C [Nitrospiraceae bacterium]
ALAEEAVQGAIGDAKLKYYAMAALGCTIGIGIAAFGTGIAMG